MASDKERREVAKRLRNGGIARDSEEAYVLLLSCVGIRPQLPATSTYKDAMVRIADLIDRPTCRDVCGRSRGDAAQEIGEVIGALRYHERHMTSVPPKTASHLAEHLERAVGEL